METLSCEQGRGSQYSVHLHLHVHASNAQLNKIFSVRKYDHYYSGICDTLYLSIDRNVFVFLYIYTIQCRQFAAMHLLLFSYFCVAMVGSHRCHRRCHRRCRISSFAIRLSIRTQCRRAIPAFGFSFGYLLACSRECTPNCFNYVAGLMFVNLQECKMKAEY